MFITVSVDACEGRDVATFDILGAYLHTVSDKDVIMFLERSLSELMVKLAPEIHQNYVIMRSKGKPLLYAQMKNALYGILCSVLLFYRKLVKYIEVYGFHINPYNPCLKKKMINNKR